jgi:hypothetical protein
MFITPSALIDETLEKLELLSELLIDETGEATYQLPSRNHEARLCKEALLTVRVLLPKLKAIRRTSVATADFERGRCATCDDV